MALNYDILLFVLPGFEVLNQSSPLLITPTCILTPTVPVSTDQQHFHDNDASNQPDDTKKTYRQLEIEYREIHLQIISLDITLEKLNKFASSVPVSVRKLYPQLKRQVLALKTGKSKNTAEFFGVINNYSHFLIPWLLEDAVKMCGDKTTKEMMERYIIKLNQFSERITLEELAIFIKDGVKFYDKHLFDKIEVKLGNEWQKKKLKDIEPPKRSWWLDKMIFGSVHIFFLIPDETDLEEECVQNFLRSRAMKVFMKGECKYNFEVCMYMYQCLSN